MKLSNKSRYGVQAVFDIAFHNEGRAAQIKEIAERQSIPPRFLEQIFQDLKRAGLVASRRGPRGGYQLARAPVDIRLGDIVRALEGPIALVHDAADAEGEARPTKRPAERSVVDAAFDEVSTRIEACFDAITVEQLIERGEALGHRRRPPAGYVYVI
jgi:Rrf2 family transcriptional regulator, iron-sulfur cluster assembly transcription factor